MLTEKLQILTMTGSNVKGYSNRNRYKKMLLVPVEKDPNGAELPGGKKIKTGELRGVTICRNDVFCRRIRNRHK